MKKMSEKKTVAKKPVWLRGVIGIAESDSSVSMTPEFVCRCDGLTKLKLCGKIRIRILIIICIRKRGPNGLES